MATTKNGTYYPSDYNSMADVPEDMKKMADSIDANKVQKIKGKELSTNDFTNEYKQKLEDLENYDDTEVKKDISDIKEEQTTQNKNIENLQKNDTIQDELIKKLQQENKRIKSALINVETEKSKSIHIENASTVSAKLEVEGNAEQEGEPSPENEVKIKCLGNNKNELNTEEIESNSNANVIKNGNGTLELQGVNGYYSGVCIEKHLKPNTTYTICANLTEVSNNGRGRIGIGTEISYANPSIATLDFDIITGKKEISFATNETGIVYIMFACNWAGNSGHVKYEDIKLEEGTVETSYSPYGQGSTEIKKINKNLYNPVTNSSERNGIKYIIDEKGVVTLNGTATQQTDIYIISPDLNNQITRVQGKVVSLKANNSDFSLYGKVTGGRHIKDSKILLSDTENEITNSFIRIPANTVCNNLKVYPQIEIGEETDYKEHQEESYVLPIQQEMLQGDCFIKEEDGWKEVHDWEKYIFTGNENLKSAVQNNIIQFNCEKNFIDRVSICNYFKNTTMWWKENTIIIGTSLNAIYFQCSVTDFPDIPTFQNWLTEKYNSKNPLIIYYKLATPTKLACTEEQSAVLDKLNELDLFGGTNNIITTEDIALLKLKYVVDTKTYVDNKYNQLANQILEIVGGN